MTREAGCWRIDPDILRPMRPYVNARARECGTNGTSGAPSGPGHGLLGERNALPRRVLTAGYSEGSPGVAA